MYVCTYVWCVYGCIIAVTASEVFLQWTDQFKFIHSQVSDGYALL